MFGFVNQALGGEILYINTCRQHWRTSAQIEMIYGNSATVVQRSEWQELL